MKNIKNKRGFDDEKSNKRSKENSKEKESKKENSKSRKKNKKENEEIKEYNVQFRKNSYAENIVKTIALTGELPYRRIDWIGGSRRVVQRYIRRLEKQGYISVLGSGDIKTIRLQASSFPVIKDIDPRMMNHYMSVSSNHRFTGGVSTKAKEGLSRTSRSHRMAECYMMCGLSGAKVWSHDKPKLDLYKKKPNINLEYGPYFYDSLDIKRVDERQMYKVSFTRILGLLLSEGGNYCVYNTNKALMKWNSYGEEKIKVLASNTISSNVVNNKEKGKTKNFSKLDSAIMLGDNMDVANRILTMNDKRKDINNFELLSFDNTFKNIHFVTMDTNGLNLLQILYMKDWKRKINEALFNQQAIKNKNPIIECDATYGEKNILTFFDGNLGRLKRLKGSISFIEDSKDKIEILCFDWQEDMVREYMEDKVSIKSFDMAVILKILDLKAITEDDFYGSL